MALTTSDPAPKRLGTGLVFFVLGLLLLIWAWGNWVYRTVPPERAPSNVSAKSAEPSPEDVKTASVLPGLLLVGFALILLFVVASIVLVRLARRYREATDHRRPPPSASDDVWAMHRLPNDLSKHP